MLSHAVSGGDLHENIVLPQATNLHDNLQHLVELGQPSAASGGDLHYKIVHCLRRRICVPMTNGL